MVPRHRHVRPGQVGVRAGHIGRGDFNGGIVAGVDSIMKLIDGEPLPPADRSSPAEDGAGLTQVLPLVLVGVVVIGGILRAREVVSMNLARAAERA